ncbi:hypothetical protein BJV77DRAFT_1068531 [Russula vinacea]|nr:hypothetical protein BJV77DRAFT_1068531 [Russula vinacea]
MRQYAWEKGEDSQDSQDDDFFDDEVSSRSIQKRTKRGRYAEDDPAGSMTVLHTHYLVRRIMQHTAEGSVPKDAYASKASGLSASAPMMMARTKSSSGNSERVADTGKKRAPALSPPASVPFTSSSPNQEQGVAAGMTDGTMTARGTYMSTACAQDELELVETETDPDADDF